MKSYSFLKKYLLAATATAALLFSACDLDEHPTSFVGPKEYYKTRAQCLAGLNACYIPINSIYDYCFLIMTEGVTDLMYIASGTKDAQLDISPAKPLNGQKIWTQCYKGVMYCNSTIAAIERSPLNDIKESSEADKLPLLAEGVVIRSFYYWLLTCIFGDVPFYTKEVADQQVMQEIAHMGRMSAKETRDYLIDELLRYVPSMDQVRSSEVADNRMGAAMGWMMIAKLAQWNHRWDDALEALGELEKIYGDLQQYPLEDIMFRNKNTPESIFEVQWTSQTSGSWMWMMFHRNAYVPGDSFSWAKWCTPSRNLTKAYDAEGDTGRKNASVVYDECGWSYHYPSDEYAFMHKFPTNVTPVYLMRLAEIRLLHAEALANTDDPGGAADIVDEIRGRAGIGKLTAAQRASADLMREAVLHERRLELAMEGFRWFDLMRYGDDYSKLFEICDGVNIKGSASYDSYFQTRRAMNDNRVLMPVPTSVLEDNTNIEQNLGY